MDIVNVSRERNIPADAVYIGRNRRLQQRWPDPNCIDWGNPFVVGRHGTRAECIRRYRAKLEQQVRNNHHVLVPALEALRDRTLVCHCRPHACHGDAIAEILDCYPQFLAEESDWDGLRSEFDERWLHARLEDLAVQEYAEQL